MGYGNLNLLIRYAKEYGHKRLKGLGVSDTEHKICVFLYAHAGVSQDDVAEVLRIDRATASRALLTLEGKGFIIRTQNPKNRRKNLLYLTDAGKQDISDVVDLNDNWFEKISSCLTPTERETFNSLCARLVEAAINISEEVND